MSNGANALSIPDTVPEEFFLALEELYDALASVQAVFDGQIKPEIARIDRYLRDDDCPF